MVTLSHEMDLLRLTTAGSVDDGKSTLIGRLLYDTKSIFEDQLEAVERASRQRGEGYVNLALLTGHPLTHWQRAARAEGTIEPWYVRLTVPRPVLHRRIEVRAREMIQRGLVEEVAAVLAEGHPSGTPGLDAVGVREAVQYLHGLRDRESIPDAITASTRQYAKRQETWFRHQLRGSVLTLDATRPPAEVAREIAEQVMHPRSAEGLGGE